jgi:hypothetical protein
MSLSKTETIKKSKAMMGKVVLLGVTHLNRAGDVIGHEQFFGTVKHFDAEKGLIIIRGDNNEEMTLPPMLENYEPAAPGIYSLKATGHKVTNPDYLATWNIHKNE